MLVRCLAWPWLRSALAWPGPLVGYGGKTFSELYNDQLKSHAVCLGLFRQLNVQESFCEDDYPMDSAHSIDSVMPVKQSKHYVITAPPPNLQLESTDFAFLLVEQNATTPI